MTDDAKPADPGQESGGEKGNDETVSRVFYIRNGVVSIGDKDIPLASPQIELGSIDKYRVVSFAMTETL